MAVQILNTIIGKKLVCIQVLTAFFMSDSAFALSFSSAKTSLASSVYGTKGQTFYCDCSYQAKSIKSKKCGILTKKLKKRQKRLEWEHIVPAHAFGFSFEEWRDHKKVCGKKSKSPRKCARKKNKLFKQMEGNIFNLVPSIGAVNGLRSNYSFVNSVPKEFELCKDGLRVNKRKATPPDRVKGNIARIYMYMNERYPGRGIIGKKKKTMFQEWNLSDPIDRNECQIYLKKKKIQLEIIPMMEKVCVVKK